MTEIWADCGYYSATQIIGFDTANNAYQVYAGGGKNPPNLGPWIRRSLGVFVTQAPAPGCWHPRHYYGSL
ncbi:MAG: hypothetical protein A2Y62_10580 [Candidatus Fischerbacteria bacterium RBG_13_37_8]|uniref:Uncharacterized protein n=1 Tax=Candidatus Fischerbacteria bacterium RBG_13_37_8 TaxID=1817863 RepID=A0A1F5VTL3_9BACT|nr:MAG: hypothetical protein A2Y62_10580 [Candidatus Fischerbacteria bacterium RBG_13_37_8]